VAGLGGAGGVHERGGPWLTAWTPPHEGDLEHPGMSAPIGSTGDTSRSAYFKCVPTQTPAPGTAVWISLVQRDQIKAQTYPEARPSRVSRPPDGVG
jgi:hypothetical protein